MYMLVVRLYSRHRNLNIHIAKDKLKQDLYYENGYGWPFGLLRCGEKLKFSLRDYVECTEERNKLYIYTIVNHNVILVLIACSCGNLYP